MAQDLDARAVTLQQLSVLGDLGEFDLRHVHQSVNFVFGSFEVLDAEGVNGDNFDARLVANLEYLPRLLVGLFLCLFLVFTYSCQSLEAQMVTLDRLNMVSPGVASVSIHDKGNVPWYRALTKCTNEQLSKPFEGPFCWGRLEEPFPELCKVRHGDLCC